MKKIIVRLVLVLIVLVILAALGGHFFLDSGIKRAVETIGPKVTKVDVKLDSASLSLFSGSGKLKNLVVGNPQGFKSAASIQVGSASLAVVPRSLLADKVVVKTVNLQGPEITFEASLNGINLKTLLANVEGSSPKPADAATPKEPGEGKKLQVDEFILSGAKLHAFIYTPLGNQSASVPLPEIKLQSLGTGPEGITGAELTKLVLQEVLKVAIEQGDKVAADIAKGAQFSTGNVSNAVDAASKRLGDILKKK